MAGQSIFQGTKQHNFARKSKARALPLAHTRTLLSFASNGAYNDPFHDTPKRHRRESVQKEREPLKTAMLPF
jgi:hypothetical protein